MNENIIEISKSINKIVNTHGNELSINTTSLQKEMGIDSVSEMRSALESIENEDRLLRIGVVGRVKAGKSSLLNALLFDGQSVLPKAATPMTAALTQISYGEQLSVEVEFFTTEDIKTIKSEYSEYKEELEKNKKSIVEKLRTKTKKKLAFNHSGSSSEYSDDTALIESEQNQLEQKAKRRAEREMKKHKRLSASHDQFMRMKQSKVSPKEIEQNKTIVADDLETLNNRLFEYVGSNGKYMPFTKSVHISLPQNNLHGIEIVDTPGINDPVQSREDRTRELLKYCDVIFIVSPSGQFISSEDMDLMDRITSKEGVQELYVISSQVDNQLMGSEKTANNGELPKVLKSISSNLGSHLRSTLQTMIKAHPEVGTTFDSLISTEQNKVIYSSGICETLWQTFDDRGSWDEGMKKVWENLTREYPSYFSDIDKASSIAHLKTLSNIDTIRKILKIVQAKKEQIIEKRKSQFINAKYRLINDYKEKLAHEAKQQIGLINSTNIQSLNEEKKRLETIKSLSQSALTEEYWDLVARYEVDAKKALLTELKQHYRDSRDEMRDAEGSDTEYYKVKKSGALSWLARKTRLGGYEEKSRTVTTIRTGAVRNALQEFTSQVEEKVSSHSRELTIEFKKDTTTNLVRTLRENVQDDDIDINMIRKSIREVIQEIADPDEDYTEELPGNLRARGTLSGSSANQYIEDANDYFRQTEKRIKTSISGYVGSFVSALKSETPVDKIFNHYKNKISHLEKQLKTKAIVVDSLNQFINKLEGVK